MGNQNNIVKFGVPEFFGCSGVPECSGVFRGALGCSGVLWGALGCSGVLWGALGCSGVFRSVPECSGVPVFLCSGLPPLSTCHSFNHF